MWWKVYIEKKHGVMVDMKSGGMNEWMIINDGILDHEPA